MKRKDLLRHNEINDNLAKQIIKMLKKDA